MFGFLKVLNDSKLTQNTQQKGNQAKSQQDKIEKPNFIRNEQQLSLKIFTTHQTGWYAESCHIHCSFPFKNAKNQLISQNSMSSDEFPALFQHSADYLESLRQF